MRVTYGNQATKRLPLVGTSANFPDTNSIAIAQGRYFADFEVQNKQAVAVLGFTVADTLFPADRPDRQGRADGRQGVHGGRRLRRAAEPARRRQLVRDRAVDDVREALRPVALPRLPVAAVLDRRVGAPRA